MSNEDRIQKYIKENCSNCTNKETDLCDIRIFVKDKVIYTKCCYFKREETNGQSR